MKGHSWRICAMCWAVYLHPRHCRPQTKFVQPSFLQGSHCCCLKGTSIISLFEIPTGRQSSRLFDVRMIYHNWPQTKCKYRKPDIECTRKHLLFTVITCTRYEEHFVFLNTVRSNNARSIGYVRDKKKNERCNHMSKTPFWANFLLLGKHWFLYLQNTYFSNTSDPILPFKGALGIDKTVRLLQNVLFNETDSNVGNKSPFLPSLAESLKNSHMIGNVRDRPGGKFIFCPLLNLSVSFMVFVPVQIRALNFV